LYGCHHAAEQTSRIEQNAESQQLGNSKRRRIDITDGGQHMLGTTCRRRTA